MWWSYSRILLSLHRFKLTKSWVRPSGYYLLLIWGRTGLQVESSPWILQWWNGIYEVTFKVQPNLTRCCAVRFTLQRVYLWGFLVPQPCRSNRLLYWTSTQWLEGVCKRVETRVEVHLPAGQRTQTYSRSCSGMFKKKKKVFSCYSQSPESVAQTLPKRILHHLQRIDSDRQN